MKIFFAKIVNGQLLTIFAKSVILDDWLGSEYASDSSSIYLMTIETNRSNGLLYFRKILKIINQWLELG